MSLAERKNIMRTHRWALFKWKKKEKELSDSFKVLVLKSGAVTSEKVNGVTRGTSKCPGTVCEMRHVCTEARFSWRGVSGLSPESPRGPFPPNNSGSLLVSKHSLCLNWVVQEKKAGREFIRKWPNSRGHTWGSYRAGWLTPKPPPPARGPRRWCQGTPCSWRCWFGGSRRGRWGTSH